MIHQAEKVYAALNVLKKEKKIMTGFVTAIFMKKLLMVIKTI
ncbi:hypothetical protein SPONL_882 [uncultured Candidatus Thioglobus sp.]|nr:hypothetical protein SPONL_882 [uncultured Candidatus Thioglobus sp.]